MTEIGVGYVSIVPKFDSGLKSAIQSNFSAAVEPAAEKVGQSFSTKLASGFSRAGAGLTSVGNSLSTYITKPALVAGGAVATLAATLGFKRLVGIDRARAQFKGLGYDADKVMKQVDKGVTNTSLSMAEGASLAVSILATGAVPLSGLETQIKRVANVSAAYNLDASQAGYLLNNVLTKQKVTWGDLSQMQKNGIPIVTALAEKYGVAGDQIMRMAQEGKIGIEDLNEVLDDKAGKAAEEYAKSWEGVTKNILSNIGKVSAAFLGPTFSLAKERAAQLLEILRDPKLITSAEKLGESFAGALSKVASAFDKLVAVWKRLDSGQKKLAGSVAGFAVALGPILTIVGKALLTFGTLASKIGGLGKAAAAAGGAKGLGALSGGFAGIAGPVGAVLALFAALLVKSEAYREEVKKAAGAWVDAGKKITQSLPSLEKVGASLGTIFDSLIKAIEPLAVGMTKLHAKLAPLVGTVLPIVIELIAKIIELLTPLIVLMVDQLGDGLKTLIGIITLVAEGFEGMASDLANLGATISGVWGLIEVATRTAWDSIKGWFASGGEWIKQKAIEAWETVKAKFREGVEGAVGFVKNLPQRAQQALALLGPALVLAAKRAWDNFKTETGKGMDRAVNYVRTLPGRIKSALPGAGGWLVATGRQTLEGFINGARSKGNAILSAVTAPIRNAIAAAKRLLGISSPSRLMMQLAGDTWDGFTVGTDRKLSAIRASAESVARAAVPNFREIGALASTPHTGTTGATVGALGSRSVVFNITPPASAFRDYQTMLDLFRGLEARAALI